MQNPIKMLEQEHEIIVGAIEISKTADKLITIDNIKYEKIIRELINFFRVYADQYHHAKEENILFPEMNKKNELLEEGIIKEMLENHEDFREMLRSIENNLDKKEYLKAQEQLHSYTEALLGHIEVENVEVFQIAEVLFESDELENIYFRFKDSDRDLGDTTKKKMEDLLTGMKQLLENN